jgi:hypothetical protein
MKSVKNKYEKPQVHDFLMDIGKGGTGSCTDGSQAASGSCVKGSGATGNPSASTCTNGTGANGTCNTGAGFS